MSRPALTGLRFACCRSPPHQLTIMFGAMLLPLPVHAGRALVINLHAIGADVALAGVRDLRVTTDGRVMKRPPSSGQHWRMGKSSSEKLSCRMTSLHGPERNFLGKKLAHLGQHGQHLDFVEQPLRRLHVHEHADAIGHFVQFVDVERHAHAVLGTELVDEQFGAAIALNVLKEQRRAAGGVHAARSPLGYAVGDLGDLQDGIGLGLDAHQLSGLVERGDPFPQVLVGQRVPSSCRVTDDYRREVGGGSTFRIVILSEQICGSHGSARAIPLCDKPQIPRLRYVRCANSTLLGMTIHEKCRGVATTEVVPFTAFLSWSKVRRRCSEASWVGAPSGCSGPSTPRSQTARTLRSG